MSAILYELDPHEADIAILENQAAIMMALATMHPEAVVSQRLMILVELAELQVKHLRGTMTADDIRKFDEKRRRE